MQLVAAALVAGAAAQVGHVRQLELVAPGTEPLVPGAAQPARHVQHGGDWGVRPLAWRVHPLTCGVHPVTWLAWFSSS